MDQYLQRDDITPLGKLRMFVELLAKQAAREFTGGAPSGTATVCSCGTSTSV